MRAGLAAAALLLACPIAASGQVDEIPELRRMPYTVDGFVEVRPAAFWLDPDAALYALRFPTGDGARTTQLNARLQSDLGYRKDLFGASTRVVFDLLRAFGDWSADGSLYEAYVSLKPTPSFTVDIGKKTMKWGKGYIWNPAAFLDRPKDPDDPVLAQEGLVVVSADVITSFDGPLRTLAFTPVLVPVYEHINEEFGPTGSVTAAGRLYLLLYDTDLDVTFAFGRDQPKRLGLDFSRNLRPELEVHGEAAFVRNANRWTVDRAGLFTETRRDYASLLVGVRYLTPTNTTFIVDAYHNGAGFSEDEIVGYFGLIDSARQAAIAGNTALLAAARRAADLGYARPNVMRDYLYARASQPDAFGLLYLNAAVNSIWNLCDGSASILGELSYRAAGNLELRSQIGVALGRAESDFGEKQSNVRAEFRARYYF